MTITSIVLAAAAGWVIAAAGVGLALGKGIAIGDAAICAPDPDPEDEFDPLAVWADVVNAPERVDEKALIDAEFVAIISATWVWPFDREEADQ